MISAFLQCLSVQRICHVRNMHCSFPHLKILPASRPPFILHAGVQQYSGLSGWSPPQNLYYGGISGVTALSTSALTFEGLELLSYACGSPSSTIAGFWSEQHVASTAPQLAQLPPLTPSTSSLPRPSLRRRMTYQPSTAPSPLQSPAPHHPPSASSSGVARSSDLGELEREVQALLPCKYDRSRGVLSPAADAPQDADHSHPRKPDIGNRSSRRFASACMLNVIEEAAGCLHGSSSDDYAPPFQGGDTAFFEPFLQTAKLNAEALLGLGDASDGWENDLVGKWLQCSEFSVPPLEVLAMDSSYVAHVPQVFE